jgi:guanylate kinase
MTRLLDNEQLQKFTGLLDSYQPNYEVLKQFQDSNFAVIVGPAGAGKDTLRNCLVNTDKKSYMPILSTTTRPKREGEVDGVDYHFSSAEAVEEGLKRREFFQAELVHNQQVSCLHVGEVRKLQDHQIGLSILIVQTVEKLRELKSDIKTVFLIPPTFEELVKRMQHARSLSPEEINRRLNAAMLEIEQALRSDHYYLVTSDTLVSTLKRADDYLKHGKRDTDHEKQTRESLKKILNLLSNEEKAV